MSAISPLAPSRGRTFHVFGVYLRAGLVRDAHATIAVETMDSCPISWGWIVAVEGTQLVVLRRVLRLIARKLALAEDEIVRVPRQIKRRDFTDHAGPRDDVSIYRN
jgi:hypothetical protein